MNFFNFGNIANFEPKIFMKMVKNRQNNFKSKS